MKDKHSKTQHPKQITLTDIQIKIGKLRLDPEEKDKLLELAGKAFEFVRDGGVCKNFWLKAAGLHGLIDWIRSKII